MKKKLGGMEKIFVGNKTKKFGENKRKILGKLEMKIKVIYGLLYWLPSFVPHIRGWWGDQRVGASGEKRAAV